MKYSMPCISAIIIIFFTNCTTMVPEREEFLFVPVHFAHFDNEETEGFSFDPETGTFTNAPASATTAFYKSDDMTTYKKVTCNELYFLTAKKEEINRFDPNSEDLLVMKTGFIEGYSIWSNILFSYSESSYPNRYFKNIYFDINKREGDYLETSFAILAVNIGNTPINKIYIVDSMPGFIELNGKIKYATEDEFLPLNVELGSVQRIEHKVIEKDGLRIIVYSVIPDKGGIQPGHCVEIIIPVKLLKSSLMKEEYKVDD